jgi:hypothetical protein
MAFAPAIARAQGEPQDVVTRADALFEQGRRLLDEGKFAEACDRLSESDRLDPSVGTLGLLARCHEKQGMLATAWREYLTTAERAERSGDERAAFARTQAAALEPRLPRLTVELTRAGLNVEVLLDGARVPADPKGIDLRLDPGAHDILVRSPGKQELRRRVTARESTRETIEVPELQPLVAAPVAPPRRVAPVAPVAPPPTSGDPRTPAGFVAGGVGLVGLGVGLAMGASALGKNSASDRIHATCADALQCAEGRDLREEAQLEATASTVGFGVAAAGIGVGAILLITSRGSSDREPQPRATAGVSLAPAAGPQGGGALLKGWF